MPSLLLLIGLFCFGARAGVNPIGLANDFVLLDESGNEGPARIPNYDSSPFGALVAVAKQGGACTATHLGGGRVVTAAHCIHAGAEHLVVFYNKERRKVAYAIDKTLYAGDESFDIAVLSVPEAAAAQWDAAGAEVRRYASVPKDDAERPDDGVTAWSYTPLASLPEHAAKFPGKMGMVFTPNRCLASQIKPSIEYYRREGKKKKKTLVGRMTFAGGIDVERHVFVDGCKNKILKGNSGSLVTLSSNFSQKIGILHCTIAETKEIWAELKAKGLTDRKEIELYFRGVDNQLERVSWDRGSFFVGSASLFGVLEKLSPGVLPPGR